MSSYTGEPGQLPPVVDGLRTADWRQAWSRSDRRWGPIRHILVVGWLLLIVAAPLVGERAASWDDVRSLVAAGEVETVRLSGELPADATGYGVVEVHWRRTAAVRGPDAAGPRSLDSGGRAEHEN